MDSECTAANVQTLVDDGTAPSAAVSQTARRRRASESTEARERRLERERARRRQRLASETAEERERGACLSAELGTGHGVQPARHQRVRRAWSSGGLLSGEDDQRNRLQREQLVYRT